jgi:hypothetical protein
MKATITSKPFPTLAQWLGDGGRADGFEEWVRTMLDAERDGATADEAAASRIIRTLSIACIECARTEDERHGRPFELTVVMLARLAGVAIMAAVMSPLDDGDEVPPLDNIARMMVEEFRHGTSIMTAAADNINEAA